MREDARTRIEHRREDRDDEVGEGFLAFVLELCQVTWPRKFKIGVNKYDGSANPKEFLQLYSITASAAGADERVMANWFPLALKGDAQTWLFNLPKCCIRSWRGLKELFLGAF